MNRRSESTRANPVHAKFAWPLFLLQVLLAFFALYWVSSFSLESRDATTYFGADTWQYSILANGEVNERLIRLHPVTVALTLGWMKLLSPLSAWIAPLAMLKALFALTGALGAVAAIIAFNAFMPRREAVLWGVIYASSMSVWYFSSIEESKIVSATLVAIYIALYLHLRSNWTAKRAGLLIFVFFLACLNEIVAALLVAIPAVDEFTKHRFKLRAHAWVALHALAAPLALLILEFAIRRQVTADPTNPEGSGFIEIYLYYFSLNTLDQKTASDFLQRWFFFNIAAPEAEINYANASPGYGGDFEPSLLHYFESPVSAAFLVSFVAIIVAAFWYRDRRPERIRLGGILLAFGAYALARMIFFFLLLPGECLLHTTSVSLVHLLIVAAPFAASHFRYKSIALALAALFLFATNAIFIFTAQAIPYAEQ